MPSQVMVFFNCTNLSDHCAIELTICFKNDDIPSLELLDNPDVTKYFINWNNSRVVKFFENKTSELLSIMKFDYEKFKPSKL
jgi:hypothetical protein